MATAEGMDGEEVQCRTRFAVSDVCQVAETTGFWALQIAQGGHMAP